MTTRIALIACSNGLGHVRRLLHLANAFQALISCEITLFCPTKSFTRLEPSLSKHHINHIDFDSSTTIADWLSGTAPEWISRLPSLSQFTYVISDNLLEVLSIRPDAWLSGSFFWHKTIPNIPMATKLSSERLLLEHKPRMISSSLFAAPYLNDFTRLYQVGLFADRNQDSCHIRDSLLISCGTGGSCTSEFKIDAIDANLLTILQRTYSTIWIDPSLYRRDLPLLFQPASFSPSMYQSLSDAIIRPGIGTVTDCLAASCKMYLLYEDNNHEMEYNATQLSQHGLGQIVSSLDEALNLLTTSSPSHVANNFLETLNSLSFSGALEAAQIILA